MNIKKNNLANITWIKSNKLVEYSNALITMKKKVDDIKNYKSNETIWFLEHQPIFTAGTSSEVINKTFINNIPLIITNRGGKMTWHGPGQRVIYVMLNLNKRNIDIRSFVYNLEEWMISTLKELDITATRKNNQIGVWIKDKNNIEKKIGSLGLRVSRGITYHGISLNINCNLSSFSLINPCGIGNYEMTSLKNLQKDISMDNIDKIFKKKFNDIFN